MSKGSEALVNGRKNEIINACEQLYKSMGFKEITLKEISKATSFTRTSIYNYFQTKEEIFLEILRREYLLWIADIDNITQSNDTLVNEALAEKIALTLQNRQQLLKIMSMNMYDIEDNSWMENLISFKLAYGNSLQAMKNCISKFYPDINDEQKNTFIYQFFPFMYGIYPYTMVTDKQKQAMCEAKTNYTYQSIYDIAYKFLILLLSSLGNNKK